MLWPSKSIHSVESEDSLCHYHKEESLCCHRVSIAINTHSDVIKEPPCPHKVYTLSSQNIHPGIIIGYSSQSTLCVDITEHLVCQHHRAPTMLTSQGTLLYCYHRALTMLTPQRTYSHHRFLLQASYWSALSVNIEHSLGPHYIAWYMLYNAILPSLNTHSLITDQPTWLSQSTHSLITWYSLGDHRAPSVIAEHSLCLHVHHHHSTHSVIPEHSPSSWSTYSIFTKHSHFFRELSHHGALFLVTDDSLCHNNGLIISIITTVNSVIRALTLLAQNTRSAAHLEYSLHTEHSLSPSENTPSVLAEMHYSIVTGHCHHQKSTVIKEDSPSS